MFVAIMLALILNNVVIYFIVSHVIDWKILRLVEEMIKEIKWRIDIEDHDTAKLITAMSAALNNSIGSKHDR